MLLKECRRCKTLIVYPKTYCDTCKEVIDKEKEESRLKYSKKANKKYNKKRDLKYIKFYNSPEWIMLRSKYEQDKGYKCEDCGKPSCETHHIKPIQTDEGWERRLDYYNLRLQCLDCHNEKHDRFKRNVRRKTLL